MRLAEFILTNIEPILAEWEAFARSVWPDTQFDVAALRDHAADILRATAADMKSAQTSAEQSDKSKGDGVAGRDSLRVDSASDTHAIGRARSGFDLMALIAEYRALRASVIRLWRESTPTPHLRDLEDLTRFNESIDQSLTEAVRTYTDRVEKSREMFLAILGHDLRSPLGAIMLSAEHLEATQTLDDDSKRVAAVIASSGAAMSGMLSDLLDFTGGSLGSAMPLTIAPVDLHALCQEVIDELLAGNPTGRVHFTHSGDLKGAWDIGRLRQLVSNLLGNALQHGPESGRVDLTLWSEDSDVHLEFHNGGPAIPKDALPTLFDPLVRGTPATTPKHRRHGSIGLGLYISREIVVAHGGEIDVKSSAASGTTFAVRLPRVKPLSATPA